MYSIGQDGIDSNGDHWPLHAAVARELGGEIKPFDVYQGPYVVIGGDVRVGDAPYAVAVQGLGVVRLWLSSDDGYFCQWYNEATGRASEEFPYHDEGWAVEAARSLVGR